MLSPVSPATESLPFRIRVATSAQDLEKVVEIRAKAYARHLPTFAPSLLEPETDDLRADAVLLLAERKLDGAPLGSTRLLSNACGPLSREVEDRLPADLRTRRLLEMSRLAVDDGPAGRLVTAALCKATYLVGCDRDVEYGVAVGRRSTVAFFQRMGYDVVTGPLRFHGVSVPLWMLAIPTTDFEARLQRNAHPFHTFVTRTYHPDIDVSNVRFVPMPEPA